MLLLEAALTTSTFNEEALRQVWHVHEMFSGDEVTILEALKWLFITAPWHTILPNLTHYLTKHISLIVSRCSGMQFPV